MSAERRWLPWLCLFTLYVVWGSTYLAIRLVVQEVPPFAAAALRFFVAGAVMALVALLAGPATPPTRRQWLDYSLAGVLFLAVGNAAVMWAETRVSSGVAALCIGTVPLWLT